MQVQQFCDPSSGAGSFCFRDSIHTTHDGNSQRFPPCLTSALGGIPKQVLRWRWIQIQALFFCRVNRRGRLVIFSDIFLRILEVAGRKRNFAGAMNDGIWYGLTGVVYFLFLT